jgi:hypothetical protein
MKERINFHALWCSIRDVWMLTGTIANNTWMSRRWVPAHFIKLSGRLVKWLFIIFIDPHFFIIMHIGLYWGMLR